MQNHPILLAIDTSLGPCSVALISAGEVIAELAEAESGKQSRRLVPMIEVLLKEAGLAYANLDLIACTVGPGGFTSIRVGLATARAIALTTDKPFIGLTTLEVIVWAANIQGDTLAVIDAYRGQRYVQRFRMRSSIAQSDPLMVDEKMITALGHGATIIQTLPSARDVALLAEEKWTSGERHFLSDPLYIREPDAKLPATEGLKHEGELL